MGAYVDVNGSDMYYEVIGEGEPVVLIHGTGGSAESWVGQRDILPDWHRVYMPEWRGHGRTADADDIAGFIEKLEMDPVRVVGWGDGAGAALRLALRRPDLVHRLVLLCGGTAGNMDDIAELPMPLLIMQGDNDCAEIANAAAMAGTAPDGRLAVIPGTSHLSPLEKPELVNLILLDFFEDKPAKTARPGPVRRAA